MKNVFLVRIFLYSNQKEFHICTLFTQCNFTMCHLPTLYDSEEEFQEIEIVKYKLWNRVGVISLLFQEHVDNNERDELDRCLQKDLA